MTLLRKGYKLKPMLTPTVIELNEQAPPEEIAALLRGRRLPFILSGNEGFTYLGSDPFMVIRTEGGTTAIDPGPPEDGSDPFIALSDILSRFKAAPGPYPFSGGAVGFFSYDLKDLTQPHKGRRRIHDNTGIPQALIGLYDPIIVYDHAKERAVLVSAGTPGAMDRVRELKRLLGEGKAPALSLKRARGKPTSNLTMEEYVGKVKRAVDYIGEGDIYQINIAQRITVDWDGDPLALYLALREESPARFGSYMDCGGFQIISNSPERLLRIDGGVARTEPIKGTRPRGKTTNEDRRMIEELKGSAKECAEHVMIVDLERNDLGLFSEPGSVSVESFERIESLKGLHHMVSTIRGELTGGIDAPEALRRIFPGGSITGAPKVRAIEIIEELEGTPRGVYTGALGWFDLGGDADVSITIRTAVTSDERLYLGVGSGIVADSVPEDEYRETLLKAGDFLNILGVGIEAAGRVEGGVEK